GADRRALLEQTQREKGLEKAQLVLIDAHGVEGADVERPHLDVLHARTLERLGRPFPGAGNALRADEAVVFVLDLQDVGVELLVFAIYLDAEGFIRQMRRRDGAGQIANVLLEAVDRDGEIRLIAVAIADVAHPEAGAVRLVSGARSEIAQGVIAAFEEGLADDGRDAEQIQHQPAVAPIVAQQVEVARGHEGSIALPRLHEIGIRIPEGQREGIVEVHAGDRLHHAPVTQPEAAAVYRLHHPDVRAAVVGDRDVFVTRDRARHAGRPQQLAAQVAVDELVQVEKVLQQLPRGREGGGDELDQSLGIVGRDVLAGQRRAERVRVGRLHETSLRRDAQRLLLQALAATL